jgi:putative hydrolase of HD superfamily
MHDCYRDELVFFTANEFENRIIDNTGHTAFVSFDDLQGPYNDVRFKPVDGRLIRAADHIAAFVEADSSISYGITSVHLRDGRNKILSLYPDPTVINGHDIGSFFASFSRDG